MYRDTGNEIGEAVRAVGSALLFVLMIPLHHALWLWLPELSEQERIKKELSKRKWADEDI